MNDIILLLNFFSDNESTWIQLGKSVFLVCNKPLLHTKSDVPILSHFKEL